MSTPHIPHILNGPEVTVLLAATGLVVNASISLLIAFKKSSKRITARTVNRTRRSAAPNERNL